MRRCTQTLEPLSIRLRQAIETSDQLRPERSVVDLLRAEWSTLDGVVLCTHGELMRPLLAEVTDRNVPIVAQARDEEWLLSKGSAWHVTLDGDGALVELRHEAPLPLLACAAHASSD